MVNVKRYPRKSLRDEKGIVLVVALLLIGVLVLLGTTAVMTSTTDMKISANYKASNQAFYAAEAGINEALYRLGLFDDGGTNAPPSGSKIIVNALTNNNAAINIDPNGLLSNDIDDDGNGFKNDISDLNYHGTYDNRNWRAIIKLSSSTPACLVGNITFSTNTIQPSGNWIEYSSSTDDGTVLTIEFLKDTGDMDVDGDRNEIVFYDGGRVPPLNVSTPATPASGQPVVVITSTGKAPGGSIKKVQVTAVHQPINIDAKAAVMVNLSPSISGSALISGFNHYGNTIPTDEKTGSPPKWPTVNTFKTNLVDNHGGQEPPTHDTNTALNPGEELGFEADIPYGLQLKPSGHKPGVWTLADAMPDADVFGGDDTTPWKVVAAPAWLTLAQVLGVSPEVLTGILATANVTMADMDGSGQLNVPPLGVTYINNLGGNLLKIPGGTGWGLMYITGDAIFQNLEFQGLIYVEGNVDFTGSFWLMGAMANKGVTTGSFSAGNGTFLYSTDALKNANKGMKYKALSWNDNPS